nr:MAG TPA: hypothetical protein [Caudoviricetes sp.]
MSMVGNPSVWFDLVTTVYRTPGGRVKLTACEPRHIWLFRILVSRARIELATLSVQSHSSGPRHVCTLILLTERKVSACSHPSRHRRWKSCQLFGRCKPRPCV